MAQFINPNVQSVNTILNMIVGKPTDEGRNNRAGKAGNEYQEWVHAGSGPLAPEM